MIYNLIKQNIRNKNEEIMNLEEELESNKKVIYSKLISISFSLSDHFFLQGI